MSCLESYFGSLPDPRAGNASHRLGDLIVMMVAASLCGATTATEFALFAQTRRAALSRLIAYDSAPSHDTFSRLPRLMDPETFAVAFAAFTAGFAQALATHRGDDDEIVAIDGKTLRRAYLKGQAASPPLTVSAFATQTRLCLAAASPSPTENEVEAALRVVELLDLTDRMVTADALHCHRRMAQAICGKGGNYMLALKGNRRHWRAQADRLMAQQQGLERAEDIDLSHGRREWRQAEIVAAPTRLMPGHAAFVRITSRRDAALPTVRLFMTSTMISPQRALAVTRSHWMIENALHWMLDVHLDEDLSRARKDHAPANIAVIKRIVRNILQRADHPKVPISHRIKKCAWSDDYLIAALIHMR